MLIGIGLCWTGLSAFIGIINLIGINFGDLFNYSIKSILFRRKRTYAALIGIAVAVGLIVTPIPIISGYYTQLNSLAQQYQYSQFLIALEKGKSNFYESRINLTSISSLYQSNVQAVSPETYFSANLSYEGRSHQISIRGINYTIFKSFRTPSTFQILSGKSFSEDQLLLGVQLGIMLNISYEKLPLNISLQCNSKVYNKTIIGLFRTNIHYDYELFAPISLLYTLEPELNGTFSLVEIKLANPSLVDATISVLQFENPQLDIMRENNLKDFVSEIIARTVQSIWLLTFVIYAVMAFGMYHIMQTITKESEREIAILKSIGSSQFQVIRIFLYQAILLCLVGSVLGVLCGIFLSYLASIAVSSITTITVRPAFDLLSISLAIVLGVSSGVIGGLYPAYSSSKMVIGVKIRI
ncbi:MAG: FtsX-like permease family protein [Candidatus Helarchaeota archaeon]|nr:FtsX-like permease family protein [Candidatus Helarchaeota archaeon]